MKVLNRNKQPFQYRQYIGKTDYVDSEGNKTGEKVVSRSEPITAYASISPASGYSQTEQFGTLEGYDKVIVTDDMNCPINENSVINIENVVATASAPYDYVVKRVAKSLNYISIAIAKVDVS